MSPQLNFNGFSLEKKNLKTQIALMDACLLCSQSVIEKLYDSVLMKQYHFCQHCEYLFLDPEQRVTLNRERDRYLEHNNDLKDSRYLDYIYKTWAQASEYLPAKTFRVLDYGCGPTKGLKAVLKTQAVKVYSYDPIFWPTDLTGLSNQIDVIFCSEVIEHVYDPQKEWSRWLDLLKPDGVITLRTSFHQGPEHFLSWRYKEDLTHVGFFNEKTMRYLAETHGLDLLKVCSPFASFAKRKP